VKKEKKSKYKPRGVKEIKATRLHENRHKELVSFSTQRNCSIYKLGDIPVTQFRYRLRFPQEHSVSGTIMLMKFSSDVIGKQNRDVPACRAVPQPIAATHAPYYQ